MPMRILALLAVLGFISAGATCQSVPASDLSGSGFIMETPNAASRQFIIANDRPFAEQVAVNRATCQKLAGCRK